MIRNYSMNLQRMRGRPVHAVGMSYQEAVRSYIRSANKKENI